MPAISIYNDIEDFTGGAGVDLNGTTTSTGNTWTKRALGSESIATNGAGRARITVINNGVAVVYGLDPGATLTALNLTTEQQLYQYAAFDFGSHVAIVARIHLMALLMGYSLQSYSGIGYGFRSNNFPTAASTADELGFYTLRNGAFSFLTDETFSAINLHNQPLGADYQLNARLDPYQLALNLMDPVDGSTIFTFRPITSELPGNVNRTLGILAVDTVADVNSATINNLNWGYYRLLPLTLYPVWKEYGSTAVIEQVMGMGGLTPSISTSSIIEYGSYDILIPKLHADSPILPQMMLLDNRQNPCVVDTFIGPFRWRIAPFTEAEIPLSPALKTDIIGVRGGGTRCTLRVLGTRVPQTFRQ